MSDVSKPEWAKEFLLVEYTRLGEFLVANEAVGETRMNIFTGLVTAVIGGIAVIGAEHPEFISGNLGVVGLALAVMLAIGILTFDRLLKRDETTKETQRNLDWIRCLLQRASQSGAIDLAEYRPYKTRDGQTRTRKFLEKRGRLVWMACTVNTGLAAAIGLLIGVSVAGDSSPLAVVLVSAVLAEVIGFTVYLTQSEIFERRYRMTSADLAVAAEEPKC